MNVQKGTDFAQNFQKIMKHFQDSDKSTYFGSIQQEENPSNDIFMYVMSARFMCKSS